VSVGNEGFPSGVKCRNRLCLSSVSASDQSVVLLTFLRYEDAAVSERLPLATLWLILLKAEILDYEGLFGKFSHYLRIYLPPGGSFHVMPAEAR
jgi:hypothetical protein